MISHKLLVVLLAANLALISSANAQDAGKQLEAIVADIQAAKGDTPQGYAAGTDKLKKDIAAIDKMIKGKQLNDNGMLVGYYLRGDAALTLNTLNGAQKKPYDLALARSALADFDRVLDKGIDVKGWFSIANVGYLAGSVAKNQLASVPLGYSYWDKCAAQGHAGCLNIMASARLSGKGGIKIDIAESISLHLRVYATGTDYVCAGAYSAESIAMIGHFTGVRSGNIDDLTWFNRANELLDKVSEDRCTRAMFDIDQYMVRLSGGENATALLDQALSREKTEGPEKSIVGLLRGSLDEAAFNAAAVSAKYDYKRCQMHFIALWAAALKHDVATAKAHQRAMLDVGSEQCATELLYSKKLDI